MEQNKIKNAYITKKKSRLVSVSRTEKAGEKAVGEVVIGRRGRRKV